MLVGLDLQLRLARALGLVTPALSPSELAACHAAALNALSGHCEADGLTGLGGPVDASSNVDQLKGDAVAWDLVIRQLCSEEAHQGCSQAERLRAVEWWARSFALVLFRSQRGDLAPVLQSLAPGVEAVAGMQCPELVSLLDELTLGLIKDLGAVRGDACARWVAGYLRARLSRRGALSGASAVVHALVESVGAEGVSEADRSALVTVAFPPLLLALQSPDAEGIELARQVWQTTLRLKDQALAHAVMCVLYDGLVVPLSLPVNDSDAFWSFLCEGMSSRGTLTRRRALHVLQRLLASVPPLDKDKEAAGDDAVVRDRWWRNLAEVVQTLETEQTSFLLEQLVPQVLALARQAYELEGRPCTPTPSHPFPSPSHAWARVVASRALTVGNPMVRKRYILKLASGELALHLGRLDVGWVLSNFVGVASDPFYYRSDKERMVAGVSAFLARCFAAASPQDQRALLLGLLRFCVDGTRSSHVRFAFLGMLEREEDLGVQGARFPCLRTAEDFALVGRAVAGLVFEANDSVAGRFMELAIRLLQNFTDYQALSGDEEAFTAAQSVLTEIPRAIVLKERYEDLLCWLQEIGRSSNGNGVESEGDGLERLQRGLSQRVQAQMGGVGKSSKPLKDMEEMRAVLRGLDAEAVGAALPAMFLSSANGLREALSPALEVLSKLQAHPYLSPESRLRALIMLRALASLLRWRTHAALAAVLAPVVGPAAEYVLEVLQAQQEVTGVLDVEGEPQQRRQALWTVHAEVLESLVKFAPSDRRVACVCQQLLEGYCAETLALSKSTLVLRVRALSLIERVFLQLPAGAWVDLRGVMPKIQEAVLAFNAPPEDEGATKRLLDLCVVRKWGCAAALWGFLERVTDSQAEGLLDASSISQYDMGFFVNGLKSSDWRSCSNAMYCTGRALRLKFTEWCRQQDDLDGAALPAWLSGGLEAMWKVLDKRKLRMELLAVYLEAVFHPCLMAQPLLCKDADSPLRVAFCRLAAKSTGSQRAFPVACLVSRCLQVWLRHPECSPAFFAPELAEVLTMRREDTIENSGLEMEWETEEASLVLDQRMRQRLPQEAVLRLSVLAFMTTPPQEPRARELQKGMNQAVILELLERAQHSEGNLENMIDSPQFARKIRLWQSLSVLVDFVDEDLEPKVNARLWPVMRDMLSLAQVRHHMECFAARMCQIHPDKTWPLLVAAISDVKIRPQAIASFLSTAGYLLLGHDSCPERSDCPPNMRGPLLQAVLPWMAGTHALARILAQLLTHHLITHMEPGQREAEAGAGYLRTVLGFLEQNREMNKMRESQSRLFKAHCLRTETSLAGLLKYSLSPFGELEPQPIVDTLTRACTKLHRAMQAEDGMLVQGDHAHDAEGDTERPIQRKIVTSDLLELECAPSDGGLNARCDVVLRDLVDLMTSLVMSMCRGKVKQDVIVCAILIDKTPNLAGLARTCEVFAASKLVLGDMRLTTTSEFEGISVSAGAWIEMEEVKPKHAHAFLSRLKKEGYAVVGLEQTSTSVSLEKVRLPERMVLLLGHEKIGIPSELLQLVDLVVEIPQMGIIRSLNVHVSGAMFLWEYTKQHGLK